MSMHRRGMSAALAAAVLAAGAIPGGVVVPKSAEILNVVGAGQSPVRLVSGFGAGFNLASLFSGATTRFGGPSPYTYRNRFPVSVAQGKRNARKARNRLRARGQHRKAVR